MKISGDITSEFSECIMLLSPDAAELLRRHPTDTTVYEDIPNGTAAVARLLPSFLVLLLLHLGHHRGSGGVRVSPRGGSAAPEPGMTWRQPGFQPFLQLIERLIRSFQVYST